MKWILQGGDKDGYSPQELAYNARKAEQLLRQLQDPATDQQDVDKVGRNTALAVLTTNLLASEKFPCEYR